MAVKIQLGERNVIRRPTGVDGARPGHTDERSDIRGQSDAVPDIASLIRLQSAFAAFLTRFDPNAGGANITGAMTVRMTSAAWQ